MGEAVDALGAHAHAARLLTVAASASLAFLALAAPQPAHAAPPESGRCTKGPATWVVCEAGQEDSLPPGGQPASPAESKGNKGGKGEQKSRHVPCTVKKMDPQPPKGSYLWEGQTNGAVYERTCRYTADAAVPPIPMPFWAAEAPPPVDPAVLAQEAVDKMNLTGPDIASPRATGKYAVGVPMWMWVNQSPTTYGPNSASATAGAVTVTATAKVTQIVWKTGDGTSVTCNGPGTRYTTSKGMAESPTCGHVYSTTSAKKPDNKFTMTATSTWQVDWQVQGGGETGELVEIRESQTQVGIGELQAVGS